jgi:hypothetical protein
MDLESSLDRMCMGLEELNFRMARIEIAIRKQNLRIRSNEPVIIINDVSAAQDGLEGHERICP